MYNLSKKVNSVNSDDRARIFATVLYPDSMPENIEALIRDLHVPAFLSPLHDRDINANGEEKKPHHHLMLMFGGKKSEDSVRELLKPLGAVGLERVSDARAYARYLCHLDNPEKAQYNTDSVKCFSGADYAVAISSGSDKYKAIREMKQFVDCNNILSYRQLFDYAEKNRDDWFRCLCDSSTMVMLEYIKSKFWEEYKMENEIRFNGGVRP